MNHKLVVATANTHESEMIHDPNGLKPFQDYGVDVLLMQEVLGIEAKGLEIRMQQAGYRVAVYDSSTGLAIAVNANSAFQPVNDSERHEIIQPAEKIGEYIRSHGLSIGHRLRPRGLVAAKLGNGQETVTVASTHPIIFVRALARAKQVKELTRLLQDPYYKEDPLIVGGDMNHYPRPRKVDLAMRAAAGLLAVELTDPTWRIRGSRHEWAARIGSRMLKRQLESFDAELDVLLYKGLTQTSKAVIEITSDHDAVIAAFTTEHDDV